MNDRRDHGQIYGYDEYGRPLYQAPEGYGYDDGNGGQPPAYDGYGYDYGTGEQPPVPQPPAYGYDYGTGQAPGQAPGATGEYAAEGYGSGYGYDYGTGEQPPVPPQQAHPQPPPTQPPYPTGQTSQMPPVPGSVPGAEGYAQDLPRDFSPDFSPHLPPPVQEPRGPLQDGLDDPAEQAAAEHPGVPEQRRAPDGEGYHTEEFSFVEEGDGESQDVIDWLKFTESRTERREEAKRRGKNRRRLLIFALVLAVLGGVAFLWSTDRLPGLSGGAGGGSGTGGAEVREVIAVHLRQTDGDLTATALLVANEGTGQGTTLLLPNDTAITPSSGTTTLGQAVPESSAGDVRDALGALLGADIAGTWRLDTPYLEVLVNAVGGIALDTNADVTVGEGDEQEEIPSGRNVQLDGRSAVAYATHLGEGEPQTAQLERFGQVMAAVLNEMPTTGDAAGQVVRTLAQIHDPSLTEDELAASLAQLAGYANDDSHTTTLLPVRDDGTLSDETANGLVRDVLGGTVSNVEAGGASRISVRDATGEDASGEDARVSLVNGGFTVVDTRAADGTQAASSVVYAGQAHRETALEAARTLGLPEDVVTRGEGAANADVTITLGEDYLE